MARTLKTLVMGASGLIGRPIVEALAAQGFPVRAGYRSRRVEIDGIEPVRIDATTGDGLKEGLAGIEQLFLLVGDVAHQTQAELRVVEAAKSAGTRHIVKLSTWGAQAERFSIARIHRPVERAIEQSGMEYTFLRPNCFMQNFYTYYRDMIAYTGTVRLPCDDARVSFIDARDIAAVACHILTNERWRGEAHDLSGPQALTHEEACSLLVTPQGKAVQYISITDEQCRSEMIAAGLSAAYADDIVELCQSYRSGAASSISGKVAQITGRPAIPFDRFASDHSTTWS